MLDKYSHIQVNNSNLLTLLRIIRDNKIQEQSKEQKDQVVIQRCMAMESELLKISEQLQHSGQVPDANRQIFWKIVRYVHKNVKTDIIQALNRRSPSVQASGKDSVSSLINARSSLKRSGSAGVNQSVQLSPRTIKMLENNNFSHNLGEFNDNQELFNSALNALYDVPQLDEEVQRLPDPVPKEGSSVRMSVTASRPVKQHPKVSPLRNKQSPLKAHQLNIFGSKRNSPARESSPNVKINSLMDQMDKLTSQNIELIKKQSEYQKAITQNMEEIAALKAQNEQLRSKNELLKTENQQLHANTLHSGSGREQLFNIQEQLNSKIAQITSIQSLQVKKLDQDQMLAQIARQTAILKQLYINELSQKSPTTFNDQIEQMLQTKLQSYQMLVNQQNIPTKNNNAPIQLQNQEKSKNLLMSSLNALNTSQNELLEQEVNRILSKFGQRMPQMRKIDKNKWLIERSGKILTLQLNERGVVVVLNDGQQVNKMPLSVYLKGVIQNSKQHSQSKQVL